MLHTKASTSPKLEHMNSLTISNGLLVSKLWPGFCWNFLSRNEEEEEDFVSAIDVSKIRWDCCMVTLMLVVVLLLLVLNIVDHPRWCCNDSSC
jgi:hypothetical protein